MINPVEDIFREEVDGEMAYKKFTKWCAQAFCSNDPLRVQLLQQKVKSLCELLKAQSGDSSFPAEQEEIEGARKDYL
jgi:hypothetical protein